MAGAEAGAALQPPVEQPVVMTALPQVLQPVVMTGAEPQLLQAGAGAQQLGAGAAQQEVLQHFGCLQHRTGLHFGCLQHRASTEVLAANSAVTTANIANARFM